MMNGIIIEENSFIIAWQKAVDFILKCNNKVTFGNKTEIKHIIDSVCTFILDKNAVNQALNKIWHPGDPFLSPIKLNDYINEYNKNYEHDKFDYTAYDRLANYFGINQIEIMRENLQKQKEEQISSNRNIAILYDPKSDSFSDKAIPCPNEILIRWMPNDKIGLYITYRSHDISAWQADNIAMLIMLNREIIEPNDCIIDYLCEMNYSLHMYEYDIPHYINMKRINHRNPQLWIN